jgi:hypothetical protein
VAPVGSQSSRRVIFKHRSTLLKATYHRLPACGGHGEKPVFAHKY